jgi:hypothetical protein
MPCLGSPRPDACDQILNAMARGRSMHDTMKQQVWRRGKPQRNASRAAPVQAPMQRLSCSAGASPNATLLLQRRGQAPAHVHAMLLHPAPPVRQAPSRSNMCNELKQLESERAIKMQPSVATATAGRAVGHHITHRPDHCRRQPARRAPRRATRSSPPPPCCQPTPSLHQSEPDPRRRPRRRPWRHGDRRRGDLNDIPKGGGCMPDIRWSDQLIRHVCR